jgi:hypothetical protein
MLRCEFKGLPGESQVLAGQYQIMSTRQTRRLISPELWESLIAPGSKIAMAVVLEHLPLLSGLCPKCGGVLQSLHGHYDRYQRLQYKQWCVLAIKHTDIYRLSKLKMALVQFVTSLSHRAPPSLASLNSCNS